MKASKRVLSLFLALILMLSLATAALADPGDTGSIAAAEDPETAGATTSPEENGPERAPGPEEGTIALVGGVETPGNEVTLRVWEVVLDSNGAYQQGVDGGTVLLSVNGGQPVEAGEILVGHGDHIAVIPRPFSAYQVQAVHWGNGAVFLGIITDAPEFTVPEDTDYVEIDVFFSPAGEQIPIESASFELPLPVPASSYEAAVSQAIPAGFEQFTVLWTFWYGGTGSGCQDQFPSSFVEGASYYARIVLLPKEHWRFTEETVAHVHLDNDSWAEGLTVTYDPDTGGLVVQTGEYAIQRKTIREAAVELELFEEGGSYSGGVPAAVTARTGAHYSVSGAHWFNYDNQESGGMGLAPTTFTREGRYFVEFTLVPDEGYLFDWETEILIRPGKMETRTLKEDGSLAVSSSWYSLDEENAARLRRVFQTRYLMNTDGSSVPNGSCGTLTISEWTPRVGDTVRVEAEAQDGYRLQWVTVSRNLMTIDEDITESMAYTVDEDEGDVYIHAYFAGAEESIPIRAATTDVLLPAPGGSYSGPVAADVEPDAVHRSLFTVESARWYLLTDGQASNPTSFEAGKSYAVSVRLAPNPGWHFAEELYAPLILSSGETVNTYCSILSDGTAQIVSEAITLPQKEIEQVLLSMRMPVAGESYEDYPNPAATFYTPNTGALYTLWRNAVDQATGAANEEPSGFEAGCVYHGTIRIGASRGYVFTEDTRVTLLNDVPCKVTYHALDKTIFVNIDDYTVPEDRTYSLSGDYLRFSRNGADVSSARAGEFITVSDDFDRIPAGKYLAKVLLDGEELTQIGLNKWCFTMPAANVELTAVLADAETYVFELEDGVHEMSSGDALRIFGRHEAGERFNRDLDGDGQPDIAVDFHDDGTARVLRVGSVFGELRELRESDSLLLIFRFGPERYALWLGGVQVSAGNKDDIPVQGGSASYDPDTRTLTLNDVTGVNGLSAAGSGMVGSYHILSNGDLTIQGSAQLKSEERGGIYCTGQLAMDGNFRIESEYGITVDGDLYARGALCSLTEDEIALQVKGNFQTLLCKAVFSSAGYHAVECGGDVTIIGEFEAEAAEYGIYSGGTIYFSYGYLWAWSQNDIAIEAKGGLNIEDGFLTATGNIQAIEVGSILIPESHSVVRPEDGAISSDGGTILDPATGWAAKTVWIDGQSAIIALGVKDLEGNADVGGQVDFGDGDFQTSQSHRYPLSESVTMRGEAAEGYRFHHWEDAYGDSWSTESTWTFSANHAVGHIFYAVFERIPVVGDLNRDGACNALDLMLLRKYLVGLAAAGELDLAAADLHGDGNVDILDLVRLRKILAGA
ncbi:MAG: dockerin type I repeat-containing protein [Oscillospiraceae bacterium]|nr:dockerin type I repeat-containing protein [Oscillospiraceae bacterium]